MVRDMTPVWVPKMEKSKAIENIKQNMFSRLKFYVEFNSGIKNAKCATVF